jgi:hypothetical protein
MNDENPLSLFCICSVYKKFYSSLVRIPYELFASTLVLKGIGRKLFTIEYQKSISLPPKLVIVAELPLTVQFILA